MYNVHPPEFDGFGIFILVLISHTIQKKAKSKKAKSKAKKNFSLTVQYFGIFFEFFH